MFEMHSGRVEARSEGRDKGSEFIVRLPIACKRREVNGLVHAAAAAVAPMPARILIVEDNVDAGDLLAQLLRLSGHEVHLALDGPSGLECFEQVHPQVVFCDIGLPGLDGYEVVARMRKLQHDPRPAVIALTGYGGAANVDCHVVKPADAEVIVRLVDEAMRIADLTTAQQGVLTSHGSMREDEQYAHASRPAPLWPA